MSYSKKTTKHVAAPAVNSYRKVKPRVKSYVNGDVNVTPYGFPTVMPNDQETSYIIAQKAGAPNHKLINEFGNVIKHNQIMENETMVTMKNPLQYSVIHYVHQLKKNTNAYHEEVFEEKAVDINRIHKKLEIANDKARNTKKIRK